MGHLAENIKQQVAIWEDYGRQSGESLPSVGFDTRTQVLSPQTPRSVLKARDKIIDSAFKLLQLAAGPSKIPSIAISYVRKRGLILTTRTCKNCHDSMLIMRRSLKL